MQRKDLERLTRDELITRAEASGVARPRSLTTAELLDELVLRGTPRAEDRQKARGWFGRAKDLLKSALERGLDLPEPGAKPARGPSRSWPPAPPPPLPTVTLAEIYAAQGHLERAVQVLDEVLAKDAGHVEAGRLRDEYRARIQNTVVRSPDAPAVPRGDAAAVRRGTPTATSSPSTSVPAGSARAANAEATRDDVDTAATTERGADPFAEDDVDEVVAVAVDPSTIYLYWEIRPATAAHARIEAPHGALAVRTVAVAAGPGAPVSDVRDERVDSLSGELFVRGVRDGAHVRVSVGWRTEAGFVPLAVAAEVVTPRLSRSAAVAGHLGAWSPPPAPAAPGLAPRHRAIDARSRAVEPAPAATSATPQHAAAPPAPRRTVLLQPAEVFEIPGSGPVPVGMWRPAGSSDLVPLYGERPGTVGVRGPRWGTAGGPGGLRGGASDLVHGGASDLVHGGSSGLLTSR